MALKVFVSYAEQDRPGALACYDRLVQEGAEPWIDVRDLLPGQNWEAELEKAFRDANVVVLLLSKTSVSKRGFFQREANDAIEQLRYKLPTDIYVIPLLLEPCDVPDHIAYRLQYVDLNTPGAWDRVRASLKLAAEQQSIELQQGLQAGPFRVFTERLQEQWSGAPGHDINIEYPRFESASRPELAKELTVFFAGRGARTLIESRQKPWDQSPNRFPDKNARSAVNARWDHFRIAHATERLLSVVHDIGQYRAGAAHPDSRFETYNFSLVDCLHRLAPEDFFSDSNSALKLVSALCIRELSRAYWERVGIRPDKEQMKALQGGAGEDYSNFAAFTLSQDHFTFLFQQYQVSASYLGRWSVDVFFYDLLDTLKPDGPHVFAAGTA